MKKAAIIIPIIAGSVLLAVGAALFAVNLSKFIEGGDKGLTSKTFALEEDFSKINIDIHTSEIEFVNSDESKIEVLESSDYPHSCKIENDTLYLTQEDNHKWYDFLNFHKKPKATFYITAKEYEKLVINSSTGDIAINHDFSFVSADIKASTGDVKFDSDVTNELSVETSTGNISVEGVHADNISVKASTGDVFVSNCVSNDLNIHTSTGKILLNDTLVSNHIEMEASTGDVKIHDSDAKTLKIKTSTGDVTGTLLTAKRFVATSNTGKISVPQTDGELCEISTSTGDIKITLKQ